MTFSTAKSVSGILADDLRETVLILSEKRTSTSVASPTTWLFVMMWPSGSTMTPDPDPVGVWQYVRQARREIAP